MMEATCFIFDSEECWARCRREAEEDGELEAFDAMVERGEMAIMVDGLPRVIHGKIN